MKEDKSQITSALIFPIIFVGLLWAVKLFEKLSSLNLSIYGLFPRTTKGLIGIVSSPLLHTDYSHLLSNTLPLLISLWIIFYFYRTIAFSVFFWIYFITGVWVWILARNAYHIGASGLVYGFLSFLFFSGIFRKNKPLLALSLLVTLLYGSIVWGIFPFKKEISFESHLFGFLAGLATAFNFRNEGPQPKQYDLDDRDELSELLIISEENTKSEMDISTEKSIKINYSYISKENNP